MTRRRSSDLYLVGRHCPAALAHRDAGTPEDPHRFRYGLGKTAHAVNEASYTRHDEPAADVAEAVCRTMISSGSKFEGRPEPPPAPADVLEGRDLALRWLDFEPAHDGAKAEVGVAVDRNWKIVPYVAEDDPDPARWSQVLDLVHRFDDVDDQGREIEVVRVTDWKTSWQTDESELDTWQLRGAALLMAELYPDVDVIRPRVVKLRGPAGVGVWEGFHDDIGRLHPEIDLHDPEHRDMLEEWRRDLWLVLDSIDEMEGDVEALARPGHGCVGCPFLLNCQPARGWMSRSGVPGDRTGKAQVYVAAKAVAAEMERWAKAEAVEADIDLANGLVGFRAKAWSKPSANAPLIAAEAWAGLVEGVDAGALAGFATALGLGSTQYKALVRSLMKQFPERKKEWARLRDLLIEPAERKQFGIWKD